MQQRTTLSFCSSGFRMQTSRILGTGNAAINEKYSLTHTRKNTAFSCCLFFFYYKQLQCHNTHTFYWHHNLWGGNEKATCIPLIPSAFWAVPQNPQNKNHYFFNDTFRFSLSNWRFMFSCFLCQRCELETFFPIKQSKIFTSWNSKWKIGLKDTFMSFLTQSHAITYNHK